MTPAAVWRVVLDMPLRRPFDYLPPTEEPRYPLRPWVRVRVPFGRQRLIGVVTDAASGSELPAERLKPILEVLDEKPVLDDAMLALLTWASDYYHHPLGEVLSAALPKALRAGAPAFARRERWLVTAEGRAALAAGEPRRAPRQRRLLAQLIETPEADSDTLSALVPAWRESARALEERGFMSRSSEPVVSAAAAPAPQVDGFALNPEQHAAGAIVGAQLSRFGAYLLHGITGSGKTEVYLHLAARVLAQGRGALILVPEIGLMPQLVGRFRE